MAPLRETESQSLLRHLNPETPGAFFDTDLPGYPRMSYIGQDSYVSGRLAGRLMNLLVGDNPGAEALVLTPDTDNEHLHRRFDGFRDVFNGSVRVMRISIESDHDQDALHRLLETEITGPSKNRNDSLGFFVTDASAHYAAEFLAGRTAGIGQTGQTVKSAKAPGSSFPRCFMVGYDLVDENRRWLEEGTIDFLLTQRPDEQGYDGINRLFRKIVVDENPPEHIYTPIDIVTKENLRYHNAVHREEMTS
jgi:LacI family transcriptional regulator